MATAGGALLLGIIVTCLAWLMYPHIDLTVFNESSNPVFDVCVTFSYGERTAARIDPAGVAAAHIQSGGDAGVFLSYRDAAGTRSKRQALYYSPDSGGPDRGFLEVHVTDHGVSVVNGVYPSFDVRPFLIRVWPTGPMRVK
jgi:hypothetical protein